MQEIVKNMIFDRKYYFDNKDRLLEKYNENELLLEYDINKYFRRPMVHIDRFKNRKDLINKKISETSDSFILSRYYIILIELEENKYQNAKYLVKNFLENYEEFLNKMVDHYLIGLLVKSIFKYSAMMSIKVNEISQILFENYEKIFEIMGPNSNEILFFISQIEEKDQYYEKLLKLIDKKIDEYNSYEKMINILPLFDNFEQINNFKKRFLLLKAKYLEKLSKFGYAKGQLAVGFLNKAQEIYKKYDKKEKNKEALKKIQKHTKISIDQMKGNEIEIPYPEEKFDRTDEIKKYFNEDKVSLIDKIKTIGNGILISRKSEKYSIYYPYMNYKIVENLEQSLNNSIFYQLAGNRTTLGNKRVLDNNIYNSYHAKSYWYSWHIQFQIFPAMYNLINLKNIFKEIEKYFNSKDYILYDDKKILRIGIKLYKEERYLSFIFLIVPVIESILRNIYKKENNLDIKTGDTYLGKQYFINLSDVLNEQDIFNKSFTEYIIWLLNDDKSEMNLRNKVCHRLGDLDDYNEGTAVLLLHLIIVICETYEYYLKEKVT